MDIFKTQTGRSSVFLRIVALGLLATIYMVPFYCFYLRIKDSPPKNINSLELAEIRSDGFRGYLHVVGRSQISINPDDLPDGDGFFDLLIVVAALIDMLLQKACANLLHLPIAGYVSISLWYLVFLGIGSLGSSLFYQDL